MNQELNYYLTIVSQNVEYQRIIYGVLKRLHIYPYHPYRADYEQEAHLIMSLALQDFHEHNHKCTDAKKVGLFLYQRLYWRLLDRLRAEQIQRNHIQFSIDQINDDHHDEEMPNMFSKIFHDQSVDRQFCHCEINQFFQQLLPLLTNQQRRYLELVYLDYSPAEIAERLHISQQAVSNLRRRVIKCGRTLLNEG